MKHLLIVTLLFMTNSIHLRAQNKKALLVIDIQENLLNPHSKMHIDMAVKDSFLYNVNNSIDTFHARGLPVLYVVNEMTNPIANWFTGNVCKKGAKGTGIDKEVILVNDKIYVKSKGNALTNDELLHYLKDNSITELYITGLFAEACIKGTLKGGIHHNFKITVIEDAVGSRSKKNKTKSVEYYKKKEATVIKANQI
jgi:nicotinamidase/pyrazinamidase